VIGVIRSHADEATARGAGAHAVIVADASVTDAVFVALVRQAAPGGVDHIVEVAFAANAGRDVEVLNQGGSLAAFATNDPRAPIPFWELVFKNVSVHFLGSDDFPHDAKQQAAHDINTALAAGWSGFSIAYRMPLAEIARAHDLVDRPDKPGRVVLLL
jgi:NADPH2:quinone reductase